MKIKVISKGKKNGIKTAQIVIQVNGVSLTKHVWHREGQKYGDWLGNNFELPK